MNKAGDGPLEIQSWMDCFTRELQAVFDDRLLFVGLQGSRGRGEGRPDSDIDAVVVLDRLTPADLDAYEALLSRMPHRELVCGFVSGRRELAAWARSELFQFARDTRPWLGSLTDILPAVGWEDIRRAVHTGACGIYHGAVHNLLHDKSAPLLGELYKQAAFVLQAKHCLRTGEDLSHPGELLPRLEEEDRRILAGREEARALPGGESPKFRGLSQALIVWASRLIWEYREQPAPPPAGAAPDNQEK